MSILKGKVALVTGGNSGIGYATAKELVAQGATVIITGRRKEAIEKAGEEIGAIACVSDQANLAHTDALVAEVSKKHGKVDILFINAGVGAFAPIEHTQESQYDDVMNVNFKGAFFTLSKFIPTLNDGASVVLLSSINGTISQSNTAIYAASKAALNSLAKIAAIELAPRKIRVNIVSPGPTETEILTKFGFDDTTLAYVKDSLPKQIPLAKMGKSEDVAKLVSYLSSEESSFITGAEFVIDGGMMLRV